MRTLLIEADADHRHRLWEVLRRFEVLVDVSDGPDAALATAPERQYELVLVGADRIQPTREQVAALRQRVLTRQGLVSLITADGDASRLRRLLSEGFDDCMPDPASFGEEMMAARLDVLRRRIRAMGSCWATIESQARPLAHCCPVADNLPYGLFRTSAEGRFLEVNQRLVAMLGYDSVEEVLALDLAKDVYQDPQLRERLLQQTADRFEGLELPWKTKTGEPIAVRLSGRSVRDAERRLREIYGLVEDVTDRKRAQDVVREDQRRRRLLLDMHEHECRWTAGEIHENFVQPLVGALLQLQALQPDLMQSATADHRCQYGGAIEILQATVNTARRMMGGLRPPILDEFGLVAAIENLVGEQWADLKIEYSYDLPSRRLDDPLETAVYRIVQEAVANIHRHSGSDRARIRLSESDDHIRLDIEDWGQGFDPCAVPPHCFGLESIRERARLFDGTAEIHTAPGRGTRIHVRLPVSPTGT